MSLLILRRPSRLCFYCVIRQSSLSSLLSCHVLHNGNKLRIESSGESFQKRDDLSSLTLPYLSSQYVKVEVCFGILLGRVFVITSVDNAVCVRKEDSSASRNDQEDRACATPIDSEFLRDPSTGRFSTSNKTGKAKKKKAAQLIARRNNTAGKAERKLRWIPTKKALMSKKKVRKTSLVSLWWALQIPFIVNVTN